MEFPDHLGWMEQDATAELHRLKIERLEKGEPVFDLSMINPDMDPPRILLDKLAEATVRPANHRYAVARGIRRIREAFSEKYRTRFGVSLDPESEICITFGAKDAIINVLPCMTKIGSKVIVGTPTYPAHLSGIRVAGLQPIFFEICKDEQKMLDSIEVCLQDPAARGLVLNFPNNPTGLVVSTEFIRGVVDLATRYGCAVVNDFVYGEMCFDGKPAPSVLSVEGGREFCVEAYSMSKAYNVPGWRVGALVGNSGIVQKLSRLKSHLDYGIFLPLQIAASSALESRKDLVEDTVSRYRQRAQTLTNGLTRLGWRCDMPRAGTAIWAEIPEAFREGGSHAFCRELLSETGIFLTPGSLFGSQGSPHVRAAIVLSEEKIRDVLSLMGEYQSKRGTEERKRVLAA